MSDKLKACRTPPAAPSLKANVLEFERLAFDSRRWRRDPVGNLARLDYRMHQTADIFAVFRGRKPLLLPFLKIFGGDRVAFEVEMVTGIFTDVPVESCVGQTDSIADTGIGEGLVPTRQSLFTVFHVLAPQYFIKSLRPPSS
jgi:hypothetical protein